MAIKWLPGHTTLKTYPTGYAGPVVEVPRPTYAGAVLAAGGSRSVRVMSDVWGTEVYATVWNGLAVVEISTAIHSDVTFVEGSSEVDATPEAYAAARAWLAVKLGEDWLGGWHKTMEARVALATAIEVGKEVEVVRGRKVPKGTVGTIIWVGAGTWGPRVGVKEASGTVHWTAASNVEVTHPEEYMEIPEGFPTAAEIAEHGEARVAAAESGHSGAYTPGFAAWIVPERKAA